MRWNTGVLNRIGLIAGLLAVAVALSGCPITPVNLTTETLTPRFVGTMSQVFNPYPYPPSNQCIPPTTLLCSPEAPGDTLVLVGYNNQPYQCTEGTEFPDTLYYGEVVFDLSHITGKNLVSAVLKFTRLDNPPDVGSNDSSSFSNLKTLEFWDSCGGATRILNNPLTIATFPNPQLLALTPHYTNCANPPYCQITILNATDFTVDISSALRQRLKDNLDPTLYLVGDPSLVNNPTDGDFVISTYGQFQLTVIYNPNQ